MKCIAVFGRKGGSGKTLVSHFLSHGLSQLGFPTVMLQTDVRAGKPAEFLDTRHYMLASTVGESSTQMEGITRVIERVDSMPGAVLVVDGGANRRNVDYAFAPIADIILIPTGYSSEDVAVAWQDYHELSEEMIKQGRAPEVYIVRNRWPGVYTKLQNIRSKPWIRSFLRDCEGEGNLFPYFVSDMPSLLDMANGDEPRYTHLIDGKSRAFAGLIARKIGLTDAEPERDMDQEPMDAPAHEPAPVPERVYAVR